MKFKKRGVGLLIWGIVIVFVTLYRVCFKTNVLNVIVNVAGWVMLCAGAVIRGKQKKDQRKLEDALYQWADGTKSGAAPEPAAERLDRLEAENAQLRRQIANLQADRAADQKAKRTPWICPHCGTQEISNFCENCGAPRQ